MKLRTFYLLVYLKDSYQYMAQGLARKVLIQELLLLLPLGGTLLIIPEALGSTKVLLMGLEFD